MESNWIADTNPSNLSKPPAWWLSALYEFDHMLAVLPSRKNGKYLLARRRQRTAGLGDVAMIDNRNPDTNMLYSHGCLPIGYLEFSGTWTTASLFAELRRRDIWAAGGGDAMVKIVEEAEANAEIKRRQDFREDTDHRARDAYRSLKARTGQRVTLN